MAIELSIMLKQCEDMIDQLIGDPISDLFYQHLDIFNSYFDQLMDIIQIDVDANKFDFNYLKSQMAELTSKMNTEFKRLGKEKNDAIAKRSLVQSYVSKKRNYSSRKLNEIS